jgi:hypothetical protein
MTDTRESLRARRDAARTHFAIAMLACVGMAAVWGVPGDGATYARMAATVTFVAGLAYGAAAWVYMVSAHWRLRRLR